MLLEWLASETGLRRERLVQLAATASKRYYVFPIKKRNGQDRLIAHPARPLKALQRWLNSRLIKAWNVHSAATAYQPGSSIRANALRHAATNFTLRVDFKDFFPSFKKDGIDKFLREKNGSPLQLSEDDIDFIKNILTRNDGLAIGSPSSPIITNAIMYEFDHDLSQFCEKRGMVYSRYADDIFISSVEPCKLDAAYAYVVKLVDEFPYAEMSLNHDKTRFLSRKYRRAITGLIITPDHKVSIGRGRKREIKSLVYKFNNNSLDEERIQYLKGMIAFCYDADSLFFESLKKKYGKKPCQGSLGDRVIIEADPIYRIHAVGECGGPEDR